MNDEQKKQFDEMRAWLEVQKQIHPEFEAPELRGEAAADTSDGDILSVVGAALNVPKVVTIAGKKIVLKEPKVKDLKQLILDIQAANTGESSAAVVGITMVEKLMLQSIEFDVPLTERVDWFENLSASDGITLAGEFARCFDLENLMKQVNTLFGKK